MWECSFCHTKNGSDEAPLCEVCQIQRPLKANICATCTYSNDVSAQRCVMCRQPLLPVDQTPGSPTAGAQGVSLLTRILSGRSPRTPATPNIPESIAMAGVIPVVGTPVVASPGAPGSAVRPAPPAYNDATRPEYATWSCPQCTLANAIALRTCAACDTPNPKTTEQPCPVCRLPIPPGASCPICNSDSVSSPPAAPFADTPQRPAKKPAPSYPVRPSGGRPPVEGIIVPVTWDCPSCSSVNSTSTAICSHCSMQRTFGSLSSPFPEVPDSLESLQAQEAVALADAEEIARTCAIANSTFHDPDFPTNDISIADEKHAALPWKRIKEVVRRERPRIFSTGFRADDIVQGGLGDCWFVSALSVLAERPALLLNLVITKEYNETGIYKMRFCKNGKWVIVTVDDYFPCHRNSSQLIFAHARGGEMWVPLLEKAYAKLHGSYGAIVSGQMEEALADLTGAPCETLKMDDSTDRDILWGRLLSFHQANFLLGASCGTDIAEEQYYSNVGLNPNHCYSLLDVRHAGEERLLLLRNPWGSGEWNGDWSDNSRKWTPALRAQLQTDNWGRDGNDGVFWMSLGDFFSYFSSVHVCKVQDGWRELRFEDKFRADAAIVSSPMRDMGYLQRFSIGIEAGFMYICRVPEPTWAFITLILEDRRGLQDHQLLERVYGCMDLIMVKQDRNGRHVGGIREETRRLSRTTLQSEVVFNDRHVKYITFPIMHTGQPHLPVVFSAYSAHPISIERVPFDTNKFLAAAHQAILDDGANNDMKPLAEDVYMYQWKRGSAYWLMLENQSRSQAFEISVDCTGSTSMTSSREGSFVSMDVIPPRHRMIVMVLSAVEEMGGFGWRCKYSYRPLGRAAPVHQPPLASVDLHTPLLIN